MTADPVSILKERLAKAEAKSSRHKKAWEASEIEVADLRTTLRVIVDVMNPDNAAKSNDSASTLERQRSIAMMLGDSKERAKAPADLFSAYNLISGEDINIETFRTTIWRMKDRVYDLHDGRWVIEGENGLYWKRAVILGNIEQALGNPFTALKNPQFDSPDDEYVPDFDEEEDDSDIPF